MIPKLRHVRVRQDRSLLLCGRKAGCGPEGRALRRCLLLFPGNSLVATQSVVAYTASFERLWTGDGTSLWALQMSMACEALICVTSVIKFSGCQSHLIAVHNSGHPDGSY